MFGLRSQRGSRAWAATVIIAACLWLTAISSFAQQGRAKTADPAVLIGPSRVTLTNGKTIEGIAVFREPTRIRVVLEDGTEIALEPSKVASVIALADLPEPSAAPPSPKAPSATARKGARTGPSAKVHAEPPGRGQKAGATSGKRKTKGTDETQPAVPTDGERAEAVTARQKAERDSEIAELAGMLQAAIANAALEGGGTGGPDDAAGEEPPPAGADVAGGTAGASKTTEDAEDPKKVYKPKPEDFDATQPVNKAGYRFLGPKGKVPETPPQTDFPQPAAQTTDLGFKSDVWKPQTGFSTVAKWPSALPPATSFPNRLSGLDRPSTSLGPHWWGPSATRWSQSTFPQSWQPKDGFAQDQEKKNPPKAPPPPPPAENK